MMNEIKSCDCWASSGKNPEVCLVTSVTDEKIEYVLSKQPNAIVFNHLPDVFALSYTLKVSREVFEKVAL